MRAGGLQHPQRVGQVASAAGGFPAHKEGMRPVSAGPCPGLLLLDWEGTWKPQTLCPRRSCSGGGQEAFTLILLFLRKKVLVGQYETELLLSPGASHGGFVFCPFLTTKNKEERANDAKPPLPRRPCPGEPGARGQLPGHLLPSPRPAKQPDPHTHSLGGTGACGPVHPDLSPLPGSPRPRPRPSST